MTQYPVVSVILATFNEPAPIISKAIQSILDQTLRELELIIIDDSTNADTIAAIDALAAQDVRIIVVRKKERIGFVPALNIGLNMARGQYISRMDGDDIAMKEKLSVQIAFLESNPAISIVGSAMYIIDENDRVTSERSYPINHSQIVRYSARRTPFAHPTVVFRRTVIDQSFRYDIRLKNCEDLDLWLRLMNHGFTMANVQDKLLKYRIIGDLRTKRTANNWRANRQVRVWNFSWERPCWSIVSMLFGVIYSLIPNRVISYMYLQENNKK